MGPFVSICSSAGSTASRDGRFCAAVLWENTNFAFKPKERGTQSRRCSSGCYQPSHAPHVLPCPCTYTPAGLVTGGLESCPGGNVPPRLFWDRGRHLVHTQEGLLSASTLTQPGFSCRAPLVKAAEHSSKNWQLLSHSQALSHDLLLACLFSYKINVSGCRKLRKKCDKAPDVRWQSREHRAAWPVLLEDVDAFFVTGLAPK